jgi:hypothetical protein
MGCERCALSAQPRQRRGPHCPAGGTGERLKRSHHRRRIVVPELERVAGGEYPRLRRSAWWDMSPDLSRPPSGTAFKPCARTAQWHGAA